MSGQAELWRALLALAAVVASARVAGATARRLGQPAVVGEIAAGILLGPAFLGAVAPHVAGALFPASNQRLIGDLAHVGVGVFVFAIGADVAGSHLASRRRTITVVAASLAVPLAAGSAAGLLLSGRLGIPPHLSPLRFALFIGIVGSVTALPVLARMIEDANLVGHPLGAFALTVAGITDGSIWFLFLFLVLAERGSADSKAIALRLGLLAAFAAVALVVVRPLVSRLARQGESRLNVLAGVVLAAGFAAATQALGLQLIFGAFAAGLVARPLYVRARRHWDPLLRLNRVTLLPMFFVAIGLKIDLASAGSTDDLVATLLLMLALMIVPKLASTTLAARLAGMPGREALALGVLLNTKGLTELVILKTGVDVGLVTTGAFRLLVVVALLATAMTMPALRLLGFVGPRAGAAVPAAAVAGSHAGAEL